MRILSPQTPCFYKRYVIESFLGEGSYGKVFSVVDRRLQSKHAVKIITNNHCKNSNCELTHVGIPEEVRLWKKLDHPAIIKLQNFFHNNDKWFFLMDYDPCYTDLFDYVFKNGAMNSTDVVHIIRQLLDAISYLALQDVDHRDIKDENILYNPVTKSIKLIDFGCATSLTSSRHSHFQVRLTLFSQTFFLH